MAKKALVAIYEAIGGPRQRKMGDDGFPKGPTDAGIYRIAGCGRHISHRYRGWSSFSWGSPVKNEDGKVFVLKNQVWVNIATEGLGPADVRGYHRSLYGTAEIPKTWLFNDFGHMTCYLYRDKNKNARRDPDETIHGEFIHTTPENEAQTQQGVDVELQDSHGCVHLKPLDIDEMMKRGFLAKNNIVVVHRYSKKVVPFVRLSGGAKPPYEVHFFPGAFKLAVVASGKQ